ncbi:MAG TPA: hypothetical protein VGH20_19680 [Myxococcales bacterium]
MNKATWMAMVITLLPLCAAAEEHAQTDLTIGNFFSQGWTESWEHRHRDTPDMALLRVTTNFLEREARFDYVGTEASGNPKLDATHFANGLLAYGLSRRLMLEVITNYQWNVAPTGAPANGAGGAALARVQLVETADKSYSLQVRASAANRGIGQTQSSLQYALAGWQDLGALVAPLGRTGLYYSVQLENLFGNHKAGARENDVAWALAVAHTWTESTTPAFGNFTTFFEGAGTTDFDGANAGTTVFSVTPGVRFWFVPKNSLTLGADLPLTSATFSVAYRATYTLNF